MAQQPANPIAASLEAFFSNGDNEVGLEVGADQGMIRDHWIKVPARMRKRWCARIFPARWAAYHAATNPQAAAAPGYQAPAQAQPQAGATIAQRAALVGWIGAGELLLHSGVLYVHAAGADFRVDSFAQESPSVADLEAFYTANEGDVVPMITDARHQYWPHAARALTVISGGAFNAMSCEALEVADPAAMHPNANAFVQYFMAWTGQAATALAARATSWRKTNHCTGGRIAQGVVRRFLQKEQWWPRDDPANQAAVDQEKEDLTSLFYYATHGSSVHHILTTMAGGDDDHYSRFNASYGAMLRWRLMASMNVRMTPRRQVSGAARVVDALVGAGMLLTDQLTPLLSTAGQLGALYAAGSEVDTHGMRLAVYARWFFQRHPTNQAVHQFDQKDVRWVELVNELAVVVTVYYRRSTLAGSMALKNAAADCSSERVRELWTQLARAREDAELKDTLDAVAVIKGASAAAAIVGFSAADADDVVAAIDGYNVALAAHAATLHLAAVEQVARRTALVRTGRFDDAEITAALANAP